MLIASFFHDYLLGNFRSMPSDLLQNIVLSGGTTMFKDFPRRLQRDLNKIVDARGLASDDKLGGDLKVSCYVASLFILKHNWVILLIVFLIDVLLQSQRLEVNVVSHPIQKYAVWFGGSVLASTPEFYTVHVIFILMLRHLFFVNVYFWLASVY